MLFLGKSIIRIYQVLMSPVFHLLSGLGFGCRFHPTCSAYVLDCFCTLPVTRAKWLSLKRLARCNPWGGSGIDLVPTKEEK